MRKLLACLLLLVMPCWAARTCNGTTDVINFGNIFNNIGNALTYTKLDIHAQMKAVDSTHGLLVSKWDNTAGNHGFLLTARTNSISFTTANASGVTASCATTQTAGTWFHVGGDANTSTSGTKNAYRESVACATITTCISPGCLTPATLNFKICSSDNPNSAAFSGTVSDVALWASSSQTPILSAIERDALTHRVPAILVHGGCRSNTTGCLLGYWPIEGVASPEPDMSGNHLNSTSITGTAAARGLASTSWTSTPQGTNAY